jgi:hypothetical protein
MGGRFRGSLGLIFLRLDRQIQPVGFLVNRRVRHHFQALRGRRHLPLVHAALLSGEELSTGQMYSRSALRRSLGGASGGIRVFEQIRVPAEDEEIAAPIVNLDWAGGSLARWVQVSPAKLAFMKSWASLAEAALAPRLI